MVDFFYGSSTGGNSIFSRVLGITLTAENITTSGATIKCMQSGGEVTGELQTGSWYILETWTKENDWKEMPYIIDGEIAWTAEAWIIPMDDTCEWDVKWEWLYGTIPEGKYRIGKEITGFPLFYFLATIQLSLSK